MSAFGGKAAWLSVARGPGDGWLCRAIEANTGNRASFDGVDHLLHFRMVPLGDVD
jgi:hypothetical protein